MTLVITKLCPMSKIIRVTVATNVGVVFLENTGFQSEKLNSDRNWNQICDLKLSRTLIIPLRHRTSKIV